MPKNAHISQFDPLRPRLNLESLEGIRPVYEDRILVKLLPQSDMERGLHIPESAQQKRGPQRGLVVSVGGGMNYLTNKVTGKKHYFRKRMPVLVEPGDEVLFERWYSNEFEIAGEKHFFLFEEQSCLAVIEPDVKEIESESQRIAT